MKKRGLLSIFTLLIMEILISIPNAQAISDTSRCENVINSIKKEENVGRAKWKFANEYRLELLEANKAPSFQQSQKFLSLFGVVYESDLKAHNIAQKNINCFKPRQIINWRLEIKSIKKMIKMIKFYVSGNEKNFRPIELRFIKKTYTQFTSILENK